MFVHCKKFLKINTCRKEIKKVKDEQTAIFTEAKPILTNHSIVKILFQTSTTWLNFFFITQEIIFFRIQKYKTMSFFFNLKKSGEGTS